MHHRAGEKRMIRLPQTHHPFAPDTSSVWVERIIRFFLQHITLFFNAPFVCFSARHSSFSMHHSFFFALPGRYTIVYLIFLLFILCPLVGCWAGCWTDSSY